MINTKLAKERKLSQEAIDKINELHKECKDIDNEMIDQNDKRKLKGLFSKWTENQYKLQILWGFELGFMYHKSWRLSKCACPKMDNEEAWPHMTYINDDCLIHG